MHCIPHVAPSKSGHLHPVACRLVISNYSRIREVERELSQLQLQVKLTAGPKKQAMEMLRKKIETQNEVVVTVRQRYITAKQVRHEGLQATFLLVQRLSRVLALV